MRILITGGAGFIGSNLIQKLYKKNYKITVLDNLSEQVHGPNPYNSPSVLAIQGKANLVRGSITDQELLRSLLADQDIIIHLAAETGTGQSMYQVDRYVQTNIGGTSILLDLLTQVKNTVRRIVVASSRSIYGEGQYKRASGEIVYPPHRSLEDLKCGKFDVLDPDTRSSLLLSATNEAARIHPSSVYGITKQVQEQLVMTVGPLVGIEVVALRYQNVYGPGQSLTNPYTGILSIFSNLIMQNKEINIFEDGLESRDFVYIDDVVDATILAAEHELAADEIFNVGSGIPTNVLTVVEGLRKAFNREISVRISGNFRLGDIRHNYADLTLIREKLGFNPSVMFDQGIEKFVHWASSVGPTTSQYDRSLLEMRERGLLK